MFLLVTDKALTMYLIFYPKEKGENKKYHIFCLLKKFCHRGDVRAGYREPPQGFPYRPKGLFRLRVNKFERPETFSFKIYQIIAPYLSGCVGKEAVGYGDEHGEFNPCLQNMTHCL